MRVLMLGNSFTYYHDMPDILANLLGAEVVAHTRGGAMLSEHLDPGTELGSRTLPALAGEKWDYVVLQEQSFRPVRDREGFCRSVAELCDKIRAAGARPLLYATWAYRDGSEKLTSTGLSQSAMDEGLYESYHAAAKANDALVADAGKAFVAARAIVELYEPDDFHPSEAGSVLAAATIAEVIRRDRAKR